MPQKLVNLAEYVPLFISDIDSIERYFVMVEPEFRLLWDLHLRILNNKRPETADSAGLYDWETMLGIRHDGTIENRRERVKLRLSRNNRYTFNYLILLLNTFAGPGSYEVDDSKLYDEFKLKIKITLPILDDLVEVFKICSHEGIISSHIGLDFEVNLGEIEVKDTLYFTSIGRYDLAYDISELTTDGDSIFVIPINN